MEQIMSKYEEYKVLRNKLRKYDTLSIILLCIGKLHEISKKPVYENTAYLPWELLYLIKIAFLEAGKNEQRVAVINDINNMLNLIKDLGNEARFLNGDSGGLRKFMRLMSFQQFWCQRGLNSNDMARQVVIYDNVDCEDLNDKFIAITGMPIMLYLRLLIASWMGFIDDSGRISLTKNWFSTLKYPDETIEYFLQSVSLPATGAIDFIEKHYEKTDDKLLQLTEQTPLKQYPFLKVGNDYYCYSPFVLQEKIKHVIYDLLKTEYGDKFTQKFGTLYEQYIYRLMDECGLKYLKESELIDIFKKKRVCDAIIELEDMVIILEIKGVEMHPFAQINPTNAFLTKQLKTSIVKSFEQIYEVANMLNTTENGQAILKGRTAFAIVVTYKEMYLSDGKDAWDEFLAEPLQAYFNEKGLDASFIPQQNILFASVNTFERFIKIILANSTNILSQIVRNAVEDNSNPATKKHVLEMHLSPYANVPIPLLEEAFDSITSELEVRLKGEK